MAVLATYSGNSIWRKKPALHRAGDNKSFGTQNAAFRRGLRPEISILHHQWQTESGLTGRPAVGRSSHYSFVFEDNLSTRPVQDGHRKADWPSEKQCFSL